MVVHNVFLFSFKTTVIDPLIYEGRWLTKLFYGPSGPLVLPTQLPSKSEDSEREPGINDECNIKANTISKETCFPIQEEKI